MGRRTFEGLTKHVEAIFFDTIEVIIGLVVL